MFVLVLTCSPFAAGSRKISKRYVCSQN